MQSYYLILWLLGAGSTVALMAVGYWHETPEEGSYIAWGCVVAWPLFAPLAFVFAVYKTYTRYKDE